MKKWIVLFLAVTAGLAAAILFAQDPKSGDIEAVFDGYFREIIARNPEVATEIGLTPEMGYPFDPGRLTEVSEQAFKAEYDINRKYLARLKAFDLNKLSPARRTAAGVLTWLIEDILRGEPYWRHRYVIDHMNGFHSYLTNIMTELHPMGSIKDAEAFCSRLEQYGRKIDQLLANLAFQEKRGIIPAKVVVDKVVREMTDFTAMESGKNLLTTVFAEKLGRLAGADQADKDRLLLRAAEAVRGVVYPAYARFLERAKAIAATAGADMGVWKLPDGDRYYQYCLRSYTSTTLTPDEIHKMGLKEMDRLQKETIRIIRSLGINEGATFLEIITAYRAHLRTLPQETLAFPNTEEGRDQALKGYQAIIDDAEAKLPQSFSLFPKARVRAQRVPEFQQRTMPSNYMPESLDGKRKGVFHVNLGGAPFKPGMKTLTYHEAVPGHHFQIALERESPAYRIFRSLFFLSGYGEGWALYAEQLAQEFGWYSSPYEQLGWLASDMGRAMRLVVDTGLHAKRWTRDQALQYQRENWGGASPFEVDRYSVFAGQACSYMVGKLKVLELREKAKSALGARFNIKEFHKIILEDGGLPLEMLEAKVAEYIRSKK